MKKLITYFISFFLLGRIIHSQSPNPFDFDNEEYEEEKNIENIYAEIPNIWPIFGGIGHITMRFGYNRHPFTGEHFFHNGIDISTFRQGDPVVATADGKIIYAEYDHSFGYNIVIQHKHGFITRYAQMLSFQITVGQYVQQGDIIGYIGNSGLSTGPHLHYEVQLNSEFVDPSNYFGDH